MDNYELKEALIKEKNRLGSTKPWLTALHIDTGVTSNLGAYEYIVADVDPFLWKDDDGNDVTFQMYPFKLGGLSIQTAGKLPNVTVNLFNTASVARIVEDNNCFLGSTVRVFMINEKGIKDSGGNFLYTMKDYPLQYIFTVTDGRIGKDITLTLGSANYLTKTIPSKQYFREFCQFNYRGEFCWMRNVPIGQIRPEDSNCDKTWPQCVKYYERYSDLLQNKNEGVRYGGFPMLEKGTVTYV